MYSNTPLATTNNIQSKSLKGVLEYTSLLLTIYSQNHLRVNSNMPLVTTDNIKSKSLNGVLEYGHRYNIKLTSLKGVLEYATCYY